MALDGKMFYLRIVYFVHGNLYSDIIVVVCDSGLYILFDRIIWGDNSIRKNKNGGSLRERKYKK
jgi:hypothetical protein